MKSAVVSVAALSMLLAVALLATGPHQTEAKKSTSQLTQVKPATPAVGITQKTDHKPAAAERAKTEAEIASYLDELLSKDFPLPDHYKAHLEAEARIKTALSKKIEIDFEKKPLTEVVQFFRDELDLDIQLDERVFEEESIDTSELVTVHAE